MLAVQLSSPFKNALKHLTGKGVRNMENPVARYESNPAGLKEVLTAEDLAELLGISVWTIYAKTSKRNREHCAVDLPPFFRMGKLIRFYRKDLISWLESRKKINPSRPEVS